MGAVPKPRNMNASLRWYYANRSRVLEKAAERARQPGFHEKRRLYKVARRQRLIALGVLFKPRGRPRRLVVEAGDQAVVVPEAV